MTKRAQVGKRVERWVSGAGSGATSP
jgi:hypothetical protein